MRVLICSEIGTRLLTAGGVEERSMLTCPHWGQQTAIPCAEEFDSIDVGRFTCEHSDKGISGAGQCADDRARNT
jgi:hypothetical protein